MSGNIFFLFTCCLSLQLNAQTAREEKMNAFINNLMQKMTLDEKIGQLQIFLVLH